MFIYLALFISCSVPNLKIYSFKFNTRSDKTRAQIEATMKDRGFNLALEKGPKMLFVKDTYVDINGLELEKGEKAVTFDQIIFSFHIENNRIHLVPLLSSRELRLKTGTKIIEESSIVEESKKNDTISFRGHSGELLQNILSELMELLNGFDINESVYDGLEEIRALKSLSQEEKELILPDFLLPNRERR